MAAYKATLDKGVVVERGSGFVQTRFEPHKMEAERYDDPKPMSSQVKTSQLSSGLSATAAWKASTWLVGGGRSQDVGGGCGVGG